ncbi:MAG: pyridoxamine 5'-phosphate oxidase family protein [Dehalococcoidia bacterium]
MAEPRAARPYMPEYGIVAPGDGRLLDWAWARERLEVSRNYWLSTTRTDGRPHAAAVWGLWFDDRLFFSTEGVKARNLDARPECVITTESGAEAVIVEGRAARLRDVARLHPLLEAYADKYQWEMSPEAESFWLLEPSVAFGFIEAGDQFQQTATRWRF